MLVLSRRVGESIIIGNDIEITPINISTREVLVKNGDNSSVVRIPLRNLYFISPEIIIQINRIQLYALSFYIHAPKNVPVDRMEIRKRKLLYPR